MQLKPDPTFYASPKDAMKAPPETLAYVAMLSASGNGVPDRLAVVDTDPSSPGYGTEIGGVDLPNTGDELHHFGWNACSAALCPFAPHPHVERRYLIVPGLRSSRIYVIDTKPNPAQPRIGKIIEPEEIVARPATRARTRSTAAPTRSTSARSATPMATARAASSYSITTPSRSSVRGRSIAARSIWRTISGGISGTTC